MDGSRFRWIDRPKKSLLSRFGHVVYGAIHIAQGVMLILVGSRARNWELDFIRWAVRRRNLRRFGAR